MCIIAWLIRVHTGAAAGEPHLLCIEVVAVADVDLAPFQHQLLQVSFIHVPAE